MQKQITILGAGYVGLTTAALLAQCGYIVYIIEPNDKRLASIRNGRSFFYEAGINTLIQAGLDSYNLRPTNSYEEAIPGSHIVFSCVGTPDSPDGSSNLTYVFTAAKEAAKHMPEDTIYVQKSTVPVGTGRKLTELFSQLVPTASYISSPEFLREGTAIQDTLFPDRVVAGGDNNEAIEEVLTIYRKLEKHSSTIAHLCGTSTQNTSPLYIATSLNSAELIKVTANAFLALKISFANSIAKLADTVDADIVEVMDAVGADPRIGRAFLNAGRGYGGGCFPKDVSGLIASGLQNGVDLEIMQATQAVNSSMPSYIVHKLQTALGKDIKGTSVAVLGLAFKAGTSDVRRSPGIVMANMLAKRGASVSAYDPQATEEASHEITSSVALHDTLSSAIKNVDCIIIATDWPEFIEQPTDIYASANILVDATNRLNPQAVKEAGLQYIGIGRN